MPNDTGGRCAAYGCRLAPWWHSLQAMSQSEKDKLLSLYLELWTHEAVAWS